MDETAGPLRPASPVLNTQSLTPAPIDFDAPSANQQGGNGSFESLLKTGFTRLGFSSMSPWAKFAFYWALGQFIVAGGLEAILAFQNQQFVSQLETETAGFGIVANINQSIANAKALTVYHVLVIIAQFFQFAMTWDAVVHSSLIQLVTTTCFNFAILGYTFVQTNQAANIFSADMALYMQNNFPQIKLHPTRTIEYIVIGAMALFCLVSAFTAHRLSRAFHWNVFKQLGADIKVKNQLQWYHVYLLLLKLDVFFFLGFTLQYLVLVLINQKKDQTDIITHAAIGIPSCFGLLIIAYFAIRRQSKVLMMCTFLGLIIVTGYLITKIADITQNGGSAKYLGSRNSLTFFETLTLVLCVITAIVAYINYRSFGTGVMNQINQAHDMQLAPMGQSRGRDTETGSPSPDYDPLPSVPSSQASTYQSQSQSNRATTPSAIVSQGNPNGMQYQQQRGSHYPPQQQQYHASMQQSGQQQSYYQPQQSYYQPQQQQRWAIE